ncbi:MAG: hypothetical protein MJ246_02780 [Clostridia bacterium]|nr:hypothetical protein [Clostridia bacterium]
MNMNMKTREEMSKLYGIINGITADGEINDQEILKINNWISDNEELRAKKPYGYVLGLLDELKNSDSVSEKNKCLLLNTTNLYIKENINENEILGVSQLDGIMEGLEVDGTINESEAEMLSAWCDEHEYLMMYDSFANIYNIVREAIEDGEISEFEENEIKKSYMAFKIELSEE